MYTYTHTHTHQGCALIHSSRVNPKIDLIYSKPDRAQWACRGAPDPSAPRAASDFDPSSHADFGAATHPGVGGWHAPSSRHR